MMYVALAVLVVLVAHLISTAIKLVNQIKELKSENEKLSLELTNIKTKQEEDALKMYEMCQIIEQERDELKSREVSLQEEVSSLQQELDTMNEDIEDYCKQVTDTMEAMKNVAEERRIKITELMQDIAILDKENRYQKEMIESLSNELAQA